MLENCGDTNQMILAADSSIHDVTAEVSSYTPDVKAETIAGDFGGVISNAENSPINRVCSKDNAILHVIDTDVTGDPADVTTSSQAHTTGKVPPSTERQKQQLDLIDEYCKETIGKTLLE